MSAKVLELEKRARAIPPIDAGHDFSHIERVARACVNLYSQEIELLEKRGITENEKQACLAVAYLHDCVPIPKDSPLRKESSRLASEKAREWLVELNWEPKSQIEMMVDAIRDHSFSAGRVPSSLLGKCLQDADRLEALGALGLYRTIATGVSMGTKLFDEIDPWAERRALDDRKFTLDHFFTKLLKLPASFQTLSARNEAQKRADYLQAFVEQLKSELT